MVETRKGWSWFERELESTERESHPANLPTTGQDLQNAYARCFLGPAGEQVLKHLSSISLDRALGPETSTEVLRHVEGQRQLVAYIKAQCERGRKGA